MEKPHGPEKKHSRIGPLGRALTLSAAVGALQPAETASENLQAHESMAHADLQEKAPRSERANAKLLILDGHVRAAQMLLKTAPSADEATTLQIALHKIVNDLRALDQIEYAISGMDEDVEDAEADIEEYKDTLRRRAHGESNEMVTWEDASRAARERLDEISRAIEQAQK